jgi:hypothetical protein
MHEDDVSGAGYSLRMGRSLRRTPAALAIPRLATIKLTKVRRLMPLCLPLFLQFLAERQRRSNERSTTPCLKSTDSKPGAIPSRPSAARHRLPAGKVSDGRGDEVRAELLRKLGDA